MHVGLLHFGKITFVIIKGTIKKEWKEHIIKGNNLLFYVGFCSGLGFNKVFGLELFGIKQLTAFHNQ